MNFEIKKYLIVIDETIYSNLGTQLTSREFYSQFFEELIDLDLDLDFNIMFLFNNNRIFSSSNPVEYLTYENIFDISKKMNLSLFTYISNYMYKKKLIKKKKKFLCIP